MSNLEQSNDVAKNSSIGNAIPKLFLSLIAALVVPTFAFFVLVMLVFCAGLIYSVVFEGQAIQISELLDTVVVIFGVAIFATSYLCPIIGVCAGSFGLPIAIVGWRLKLIQKRTGLIVGFLVGFVCAVLFEIFGYSGASRSANGIDYMIDGIRTLNGWIEFGVVVLITGLLGTLGGYSFWFVWNLLTRSREDNAQY